MPSAANVDSPDDYLLVKPQYVVSYSRSRVHANWVSWHLDEEDLGSADRQDDFRPDSALPTYWLRALTTDYTYSGFDRGHLCPSADRTSSTADNSATFLMTNIIPQSPVLNQEAWAYLEEYCRDVARDGYELYIVAGTYGTGGVGEQGLMNTIGRGINVPAGVWKVIVVVPEGMRLEDTYGQAQVIAVDMPNSSTLTDNVSWLRFVTTPQEIGDKAQASFFERVPEKVRSVWLKRTFQFTDGGLNVDTKCRMYNSRQLYMGPKGGCYYINSNGNKTYVDRGQCDC